MAVDFFYACSQVVLRQEELLPGLAKKLGVNAREVFYVWAGRKCEQRGVLEGEEWSYFFHGLECDLKNLHDGRFLRIDFGPGGRFDAFTPWGVSQFVMTSKAPWPDFIGLREYLAQAGSAHHESSASLEKATGLCARLEKWGFIETADKLLLRLAKKHTRKKSGIETLSLLPGRSERTYFDVSVANRKVLSAAGRRFLGFLERHKSAEICLA